ncbi:hypothetical protein J3R83DRAFT_12259, partial [Lanmaoa asiatica]
SAAKSLGQPWSNLTICDWTATAFPYIDAHPDVSQDAIVEHFKSHPKGSLVFTQSTLSWKL